MEKKEERQKIKGKGVEEEEKKIKKEKKRKEEKEEEKEKEEKEEVHMVGEEEKGGGAEAGAGTGGDDDDDEDKWSEQYLETQLDDLKKPAIKPGDIYIYPLWKSLLSKWLSTPGYKVYLVTPFLDLRRLVYICKIVIQNNDKKQEATKEATEEKNKEATIEAFYLRNKCYQDLTVSNVMSHAKGTIEDNFGKDYSDFIDEKITSKIFKTTGSNYFHAKLFGCTYEENAEVVVTSANFTDNHFDSKNYDSVVYHTMTKKEFLDRFINPLKSISAKY